MATKEYTELQLKAKDEGIKSWHVKSDDQLSEELAAKWENDAVNSETEEKTEEEAPEETPEETPEVEGNVTFYWKNGRDVSFQLRLSQLPQLLHVRRNGSTVKIASSCSIHGSRFRQKLSKNFGKIRSTK